MNIRREGPDDLDRPVCERDGLRLGPLADDGGAVAGRGRPAVVVPEFDYNVCRWGIISLANLIYLFMHWRRTIPGYEQRLHRRPLALAGVAPRAAPRHGAVHDREVLEVLRSGDAPAGNEIASASFSLPGC